MNEQVVARKAQEIARDTAQDQELNDAEWECLEDLLKQDKAFGLLVTAQWSAVAIDHERHDVDLTVEDNAREAAEWLGNARDRVIEQRLQQAREIVALAEKIDSNAPWGVTIDLYLAGFSTLEELREADQEELIDEADVAPSLAARIKAAVGYPEGESR